MSYEGILFDLDGTLIDSLPDLAWSLDRAMEELDLPVCGEARARGWIGNGVDLLVTRALAFALQSQPEPEQVTEGVRLFRQHYQNHSWVDSRLYPGVKDTLKRFHEVGVRMACVTNKPAQFAGPLIEAAGLADFFSAVLGTALEREKKPDPQMALEALDLLQLNPSQALFVGDSITDFATARNAGLPIWLVSYGYNSGLNLHSLGAERVIDKFFELGQLV